MPPKVTPPRPRPGQQRQRRPRLESLGSPAPTLIRATTPVRTKTSTRPVLQCSNPQCPSPNVVETEDGAWVCNTCGAVAQEESHLVGEVEFTELQGGRIAQAGTHIGASQTHQRTYALGGATGVAGREATATRDKTEADARRIMQRYIYLPDFRIRESEVDSGMNIFKLAYSNGFIQGRTIESVAIVSLYLACRRKYIQEQGVRRPVYALMLIDFAETVNINVFALGRMYGDLLRKLFLRSDGRLEDRDSADLLAMGPEVLVERFVSDLSFGADERKVRDDAIRIVRRMNRDWMTTGRRPSGVCGAAILLAARMNNYRRTTREVVLTAKVTEITINKRLEEFADTESSHLSVSDFRDADRLDATAAADPPAYQRAHNPSYKKKRTCRRRKAGEGDTAAEIEGDDPENSTSDAQEPASKRPRIDAEGYKIPDIPARRQRLVIDLSQQGSSASQMGEDASDPENQASPRRTRGRPAGSKNWRAPPASAAELAIEADLERDVLDALRQNPELDPSGQAGQASSPPENAQPEEDNDDSQENSETEVDEDTLDPTTAITDDVRVVLSSKGLPGPAVNTNIGNLGQVSLSPTLKPDEFEDDPDIATCLLNEEEKQLKERVWVTENADWLRQDHAKRIKRELKEAEMREKGIDPTKQPAKGAQRRRKDGARRAGRLGDVSYLNDPEPGREVSSAVAGAADGNLADEDRDATPSRTGDRERTASESVRKMMKTRGVYSRRVNYDVLDSIYGADSSDSRSRSRSASVSVSVGQGSETGNDGDRAEDDRADSVAGSATSQGVSAVVLTGSSPRTPRDQRRRVNALTRAHGMYQRARRKGSQTQNQGRSPALASPRQTQRATTSEASGDDDNDDDDGEAPVPEVPGRSSDHSGDILPTPPMTLPAASTSTEIQNAHRDQQVARSKSAKDNGGGTDDSQSDEVEEDDTEDDEDDDNDDLDAAFEGR